MTIKDLRKTTGLTQKKFAERFNIKLKTLQRWEQNRSKPPECLIRLIEKDLIESTAVQSKDGHPKPVSASLKGGEEILNA